MKCPHGNKNSVSWQEYARRRLSAETYGALKRLDEFSAEDRAFHRALSEFQTKSIEPSFGVSRSSERILEQFGLIKENGQIDPDVASAARDMIKGVGASRRIEGPRQQVGGADTLYEVDYEDE